MPTISETLSATYDEVTLPHHPGGIVKYLRTSTRTWGVNNVTLISRNSTEATANQKLLNLLRSWTMPFYGYGTEKTNPNELGAPPEVLKFTAYGDKNIGPVNVVLESLSFEWPNDCDYLHTSDGQPFPVLLHLTLSLKEAWSPKEVSGFDLMAFKNGDMVSAYNSSASGSTISGDVAMPIDQARNEFSAQNPNGIMNSVTNNSNNPFELAKGELKSTKIINEASMNLGMNSPNIFSPTIKSIPNSPWNSTAKTEQNSILQSTALNMGLK